MARNKSFADFVSGPENRAAFLAVKDLAVGFSAGEQSHGPNPHFLHGPAGTGKSHLVSALLSEIGQVSSGAVAKLIECGSLTKGAFEQDADFLDCDLLVFEDMQFLPPSRWESVVQVLEQRAAQSLPTVVTANVGPQQLSYRGERFSNRFASRLAAGLVIGLGPLQASSRRVFLECEAKRRQLTLDEQSLSWLAENLGGGARQLEGALNRLEQVTRFEKEPLDVAVVARNLAEEAAASRPSMEQIALQVSGHFRVPARQLQSRRRSRNVVLPRQVGMFLARRLTRMSLGQIGAYFGGRDHTTVLHACRKVEEAIEVDAKVSGAVQQICARFA